MKSLQTSLAFIKEQEAKHREDKVLLLHRPKQPEPATATPAAPSAVVEADERASQG